jgi:hypothetical protein
MGDVAIWFGLAVLGGVIGNSAYDLGKLLVKRAGRRKGRRGRDMSP